MTITSAADMDQIDWARAADQFGNIVGDGSSVLFNPTGVVVNTFNGVTYVLGTFKNGDLQLHKYALNPSTGQYEFTKLAHYQGGSDPGDSYATAGDGYDSPNMQLVGDTLVIVADSENNLARGWTFDTTSTPSNPDVNGLEFHSEFLTDQGALLGGSTTDEQDMLQTFTLSNGETYYLRVDSAGRMFASQTTYDQTTNELHYETDSGFDINAVRAGDAFNGSMVFEQRWLESGRASLSTNYSTGDFDADFWQVGDTIYGVHGGGGAADASATFTKWELDSDGQMTASQIVYTDGTTTKDLADLGYTSISSYPTTSPFSGAPSLGDYAISQGFNANGYLQAISGVATKDVANGSIDAIDLGQIQTAQVVEVDGKAFLVASTWNGTQNGIATFSLDPATGLPTALTGLVEMTPASSADADDVVGGVIPDGFNDVTLQKLDATGEYVLTISGGDGLVHLAFDPTKSSTANGQGTISFIGIDKGAAEGPLGYLVDSYAGNASVSESSNQTQYEILPDGKVLTVDISGYWVGDPGVSSLATVCYVAGTKILTPGGYRNVETLNAGDMVVTRDNGKKPIKWIGRRTMLVYRKEKKEKFYPVRIQANALGAGVPFEDLYLSQQHRVVIRSKIARRMFGVNEVFIPAKKLTDFDGIDIDTTVDTVIYFHFLFDQHEVIYSNGAETESLFTGVEALKTASKRSRDEILSVFPELSEMNFIKPIARFVPPPKRIKKLSLRHSKNNKYLYKGPAL